MLDYIILWKMYKKYIIITGILIVFYVLFVNAWVCDDAYITFRTVDNFVKGYGLTWNVTERVQAYTHPAWMFLVSAFYFITREPFLTSIGISIALTLFSLWLILKYFAQDKYISIVVIALVLVSKSFIDYSVSGLENPLSHCLLVLFFTAFFFSRSGKKLLLLSLIFSTAMLNRYDLALVFGPPLLYAVITDKNRKLMHLVLGLLPVLLWAVFSLLYYGSIFPNTAYAKLNTGIPRGDYIIQGLYYFQNLFYSDPVTLLTIAAALALTVYRFLKDKDYIYMSVFLSVIFYLIYIIYIGGDFMSGRFFTVPFTLSLLVIAMQKADSGSPRTVALKLAPAAVLVVLGLLQPNVPLFCGAGYGSNPEVTGTRLKIPFTDEHLITDERAYYFQANGLCPMLLKGRCEPDNEWGKLGKKSAANAPLVICTSSVGMFGYYSGQDNYIVDEIALPDAFLSKLPQEYMAHWRIGHIQRTLPDGYIESLNEKKNLLRDDNLRKYYDAVRLIISGNIFDIDRLETIVDMNLGRYDHLLKTGYQPNEYPVLTSGDSTTLSYYYNDLSLYYFYSMNDVQAALQYSLRSGRFNPYFDYTYYNAGIYYWKGLNKHKEAIALIRKSLTLNPAFPEAYQALGEIYCELQNKDSADYYTGIFNKMGKNSNNGK